MVINLRPSQDKGNSLRSPTSRATSRDKRVFLGISDIPLDVAGIVRLNSFNGGIIIDDVGETSVCFEEGV
jgi:hypothetical protein